MPAIGSESDFGPTLRPRSIEIATAEAPAATKSAAVDAPKDPPAVAGDPVASPDAPHPTVSPPASIAVAKDAAPSNPATEPVFASQGPPSGASHATVDDYNPFARVSSDPPASPRIVDSLPVNREIPTGSAESQSVAEAPKKKWGELVSNDSKPVVVQPTRATTPVSLVKRLRTSVEGRDNSIAQCTYDSRLRKVIDFRLPDLEGKPVRFQDLDADYVLLDFWGTWCPPCLDSIPHLVALQKKYGPGKLRVVGIACEDVPPEQRKARVDEASRKLGINYAVLLSGMDGKPCPVQQALQIQAMPTMILLDRKGQVLWRSTGATPSTEERLDRVLASSIGRGDTARR
jgi:thiol-disulfide isomerase/thioredoxin